MRLLQFLSVHRRQALAGLAAITAVNAVQLFIPQVVRRVIDELTVGAAPSIAWAAGALAILVLLVSMLRYLWRIFLFGLSKQIRADIRRSLAETVLRAPIHPALRRSPGEILSHYMSDADAVAVACGTGLLFFADATFLLLFSIIAMANIHLGLTLMSISPLVLIAVTLVVTGPIIRRRAASQQASLAELGNELERGLSQIRIVKAQGRESELSRTLITASLEYRSRQDALSKVAVLIEPWASLVAAAANIIALIAGSALVMRGEISLGSFAVFGTYLGLVAWPMSAIGHLFTMFQKGSASATRIERLRNELQVPAETYAPSSPVAARISQFFGKGSALAVLGTTGSGKSSSAQAIVRQTPGAVYLPAEPGIVAGSIRENLELFTGSHKDEELWEALRMASIDEEIRSFPLGLETPVGEGGVTLSGGQRQRVALARLFLVSPESLILDEPLSAVDRHTAERVWASLLPWLSARKTIVFTSRVQTARRFPYVLVLSHFEVADEGPPAELKARPGVYQTLHSLAPA